MALPVFVWHDGDEEPPMRDKNVRYWAKWTPDIDRPERLKVDIVTYARLWTLFGDGELQAWAGPILPPLEDAR